MRRRLGLSSVLRTARRATRAPCRDAQADVRQRWGVQLASRVNARRWRRRHGVKQRRSDRRKTAERSRDDASACRWTCSRRVRRRCDGVRGPRQRSRTAERVGETDAPSPPSRRAGRLADHPREPTTARAERWMTRWRGGGADGDSATVARAWTSLAHSRPLQRPPSTKRNRSVSARWPSSSRLGSERRAGAVAQRARHRRQRPREFRRRRPAVPRDSRRGRGGRTIAVYVARARATSGLAYANMGDVDRARTEFIAFRDFAGSQHMTLATKAMPSPTSACRDSRGRSGRRHRVARRARDAATRAIPIAVGEENALGQLGVAWQELGETPARVAYFDSALAVATKNGPARTGDRSISS